MSGRAVAYQGVQASGGHRRVLPTVALAAVVVAVGVLSIARFFGGDAHEMPPGVYSLKEGKLLYAYHRLTDSDCLFDLEADPGCVRNLSRTMPLETRQLRKALSRRLGVHDLAELPFKFSDGPA